MMSKQANIDANSDMSELDTSTRPIPTREPERWKAADIKDQDANTANKIV